MANRKTFLLILSVEFVAFLILIGALWADEAFDFANILFGSPKIPFNLVEAIAESFLVLVLACGVAVSNIYLFRRIKQLEGLHVICAFCKNVRMGEEWLPLEEFLSRKTDVTISHSFCNSCAKKHYGVTL